MASAGPSQGGRRQREVMAWMSEFSPAGKWLAVDDRPSYFQEYCPNLFKVPGLHPNEGVGINSNVADDFKIFLKEFLE